MKRLSFNEIQKFNQPWIWLIILSTSGLVVGLSLFEYISGMGFENQPFPWGLFLLVALGAALPIVLMGISKMETEITDQGIKYRLFPFQVKFREIRWDEIKSAEVREYSPMKEFGGWGIRFGFQGRAINVRGNQGLQLTLTSGKKILLGTQKPEEIALLLNRIQT